MVCARRQDHVRESGFFVQRSAVQLKTLDDPDHGSCILLELLLYETMC